MDASGLGTRQGAALLDSCWQGTHKVVSVTLVKFLFLDIPGPKACNYWSCFFWSITSLTVKLPWLHLDSNWLRTLGSAYLLFYAHLVAQLQHLLRSYLTLFWQSPWLAHWLVKRLAAFSQGTEHSPGKLTPVVDLLPMTMLAYLIYLM